MLNSIRRDSPFVFKQKESHKSIYLCHQGNNILTINLPNDAEGIYNQQCIQENKIYPKSNCNKCGIFMDPLKAYSFNSVMEHLNSCDNVPLDELQVIHEEPTWNTLKWSEIRLSWLIKDHLILKDNHCGDINVSMLFRFDNDNPDKFLSFILSTTEASLMPILMGKKGDELKWNIPIKEMIKDVLIDKQSYKTYQDNLAISNNNGVINDSHLNDLKNEVEWLYKLSTMVVGEKKNQMEVLASLIQGSLGKLPKDGDIERSTKKKRVKDQNYYDNYAGDIYCFKILKDSDLFDATYPFSVLAFRSCDSDLINFLSSNWILYVAQEANTVYGSTDYIHYYSSWISSNLCFEKLKSAPLASELLWSPQVFSVLLRKFVGGRSVEVSRGLLNTSSSVSLRSATGGGFGVACALAFKYPDLSENAELINLIGILAILSHDLWQEVDDNLTGDTLNIAYLLRREGFCPISVWIDAITNGYFPDHVVYLLLGWALGTFATPRYASGLIPPLVAYSGVESPLTKVSKLLCNVEVTPNKYNDFKSCELHDKCNSEEIIAEDKIDAGVVRKCIIKYCKDYENGENCSCVYNILFDWLKTKTLFIETIPDAKVYRL